MCGIVGIAGNLFAREELTMKRLLLLDSIRGMDSTGLAAVRMGGLKVEVAKKATHIFNLADTKSFAEALIGTSSLAFIGHNRSATVGKISDVNAHPFKIDHITGVHNGTLEDKDKGILEDLAGESFNTDSEALFAAIAKCGVKEVIPKITTGRDSYKGAWSLVWWDSKDRTLNFLRNQHRPMWYCYSEDFKLIFWASEFWILDAVLQKSGNYALYQHPSEKTPEKKFRFFETKADIHYSVDIEKLAKGGKERPKIAATTLAGKEPVEAATSHPFGNRSNPSGKSCGHLTHTSTLTPSSKKNTKTTNQTQSANLAIITLSGDIDNPYAGYWNEQGFSWLGCSHGSHSGVPECSWCHEKIPYGQPGLTIFTRHNTIICNECSGGDATLITSDFAPATRVYVSRLEFDNLRKRAA